MKRSSTGRIPALFLALVMVLTLALPMLVYAEPVAPTVPFTLAPGFTVTAFDMVLGTGGSIFAPGYAANQDAQFEMQMNFTLADGTFSAASAPLVITLPSKLQFGTAFMATADLTFDVKTPGGDLLAVAVADKDANTLTLTFTDYPVGRYGVTGVLKFWTQLSAAVKNTTSDTIGLNNSFAGSNASFDYVRSTSEPTETFAKYGSFYYDEVRKAYYVQFTIRVNAAGTLEDITEVTDAGFAGGTVDPETFELRMGVYTRPSGSWVSPGTAYRRIGMDNINQDFPVTLTMENGGQGFKIVFDPTYSSGAHIVYRTYFSSAIMPEDGSQYVNSAQLKTQDDYTSNRSFTVTFRDAASGEGEGYVGGITINKFESNTTKALNDATFVLKNATGAETIASFVNNGDGTYSLSGLLLGTYQIVETAAPAGYVLDSTPIMVTLTAENPTVTKTVYNDLEVIEPASLVLTAKKELTGRTLAAGEFTFTVYNANNQPVSTGTNAANGDIAFSEISYDDIGTYSYTIKEDAGSLVGVTYDATGFAVTVTVADVDGTLVATPSYPVAPVFKNTYAPSAGRVVLAATKELTGRDLVADEFSFTVYNANNTPVSTGKNAANGTITFAAINYTAEGTYSYTIKEDAGSLTGVTYDTTAFAVTVTVADVDGTLVATPSYPVAAAFKNAYVPGAASFAVTATKELTGRDLNEGEFSFKLFDGDEVEVGTATNAADGTIDFAAINYTEEGNYFYTIKEDAGTLGGVTYDATAFPVVVTVVDVDGTLRASMEYEVEPIFENSYAPSATELVLSATKVLTGRTLKADEFSFKLLNDDNEEVSTAKNAANGTITFDAITYEEVGTYSYTIKEVIGTLGGVTYDTAAFTVTVTVTDPGTGTLVAEADYEADPVFTNRYAPGPVVVALEATKVLSGKTLIAGEFSFKAYNANGVEVGSATNDANGNIVFAPMTFNAVGTYKYTVREIAGNVEGMVYDAAIFTLVVTVTDNGAGALVANVSVEGADKAEFVNIYSKPPKKTGESTSLFLLIAMCVVSVGAVTILALRKKKITER